MARISLVSYTNSLPFKYGIENALKEPFNLTLDYPAQCAAKLMNGEAEVGLVPVAALPKLSNFKIISDYCIGAQKYVDSVLLVSEVPLSEIKKVILDYQSMTSVKLTQILFAKYWKKKPAFEKAELDFIDKINGTTAAVVIGDRALDVKSKFKFVYDLATEWYNFTNTPFVFAVWVAHKNVSKVWIDEFNNALKIGIENIALVAQKAQKTITNFQVLDYLQNKISYNFNVEMQRGLALFSQYSKELEPLLTK